ncbi:MAG: hypothetical protein JWM74_3509 [Myxococcaceae bacterium]|nr:hypothetical protein [Myxococcaceae bacterium]
MRPLLVLVPLVPLAFASLFSACSDDATPSVPHGEDAGFIEADTVPDAALPADEAGCVIATSEDPFCRSLSCPGAGCNPSGTCQADKLRDCPAYASASSDAFKTANVECAATADCKSLLATDDCIFGKLEAAPRTASQKSLAKSYCARCGADAGSTCETDFYARTSAVGLSLLFYADSVLDEIDAQCKFCGSVFSDCALPVADKKLPLRPASCK